MLKWKYQIKQKGNFPPLLSCFIKLNNDLLIKKEQGISKAVISN